jgi:hypothetical protein
MQIGNMTYNKGLLHKALVREAPAAEELPRGIGGECSSARQFAVQVFGISGAAATYAPRPAQGVPRGGRLRFHTLKPPEDIVQAFVL